MFVHPVVQEDVLTCPTLSLEGSDGRDYPSECDLHKTACERRDPDLVIRDGGTELKRFCQRGAKWAKKCYKNEKISYSMFHHISAS